MDPRTLAAPPAQHLWARLNAVCEQQWPALQAQVAEQTGHASLSMEVLQHIDSTNSELMRRARQGQTEPTLLVAIDQTAGRGRMGKAWHSTPGASLTFSLGLPLRPADWSGLSLAVGVSVADSLARLLAETAQPPAHIIPPVQLKWPNDLWLNGQKLAGILVETALAGSNRYVVMGIGINIAVPAVAAVPDAALLPNGHVALPPATPTGLAAWADSVDASVALASVLPTLLSDVLAFEASGFAAFAHRFAARDALAGQSLRLSDGTQGIGQGVDSTGALLVRTAQGLRSVHSAEVSVRPTASTDEAAPC